LSHDRLGAPHLAPSNSVNRHHHLVPCGVRELLEVVSTGMVQAWVGQKLVKRNILQVFFMSNFCVQEANSILMIRNGKQVI
jgi:hypothetical protein